MKRLSFLFVILLFLLSACQAQKDNKPYIKKIKELCPKADTIEVEHKETYVEVKYKCDGQSYKVGIDESMDVLFTEHQSDLSKDLMAVIKQKLSEKYNGWDIDETHLVKMLDTTFYKVELKRGFQKENLYFTLQGNVYKMKNFVAHEEWNTESFSQSSYYAKAPYDFLHPRKIYEMPEELLEISGITVLDAKTLLCIQDESGIVFKYDTQKEQVTDTYRFSEKGDYEDVTIKKDTVYVLRSDGALFYFNYKNFTGKIFKTDVSVKSKNLEGLSYSKHNNLMYIASKAPSANGSDTERFVYKAPTGFTKKPKVAFTIDFDDINAMVGEKYPFLKKKKLEFNTSAVAINPITNEKYVLSASSRLIAIYSKDALISVYPLPAELYYQPEGMAFTNNGDLYLSSEGSEDGYLNGQIYFLPKNKK